MFEKLLLATTLTLSLKVFLALGGPPAAQTPVRAQLQQSSTQTVSQLPR